MATTPFGTTILEPGEEVGGGVNHSSKTSFEVGLESIGKIDADTPTLDHQGAGGT